MKNLAFLARLAFHGFALYGLAVVLWEVEHLLFAHGQRFNAVMIAVFLAPTVISWAGDVCGVLAGVGE